MTDWPRGFGAKSIVDVAALRHADEAALKRDRL
jgi:hypothetical protein